MGAILSNMITKALTARYSQFKSGRTVNIGRSRDAVDIEMKGTARCANGSVKKKKNYRYVGWRYSTIDARVERTKLNHYFYKRGRKKLRASF